MMIFRDDQDRQRYLDLLGWVVREYEWDCIDYCLMGTHIHLLVRTRPATLSLGMKKLHWYHAVEFNERHTRLGHLFERRFGSNRIWTPERFDYTRAYIQRNPVAAGLAATPEDWPWGSAAARASGDRPQWLASRHTVAEIRAQLDAPSYTDHVSSATSVQLRPGGVARLPDSDSDASSRAA